jgi:hypothetical protein
VTFASAYGSTELGPMTNSFRDIGTKDDWAWIQLSNHVTARWIPQDQDLFELHVMSSDTQPMAVTNLPNGDGYATGDLFLKHPTVDGLWKMSVFLVVTLRIWLSFTVSVVRITGL